MARPTGTPSSLRVTQSEVRQWLDIARAGIETDPLIAATLVHAVAARPELFQLKSDGSPPVVLFSVPGSVIDGQGLLGALQGEPKEEAANG